MKLFTIQKFKIYQNKINQMSYRQRASVYLVFTGLSFLAISYESIAVIPFIFWGYKTMTNINAMKLLEHLMEAEKTTEFIHEDKIYDIKTSSLLFRVDHKYFYDRILGIEEYRYYSTLYLSANENYFLYIMRRNYQVKIEPLSESQAKQWLIKENVELYKQTFGEIEKA